MTPRSRRRLTAVVLMLASFGYTAGAAGKPLTLVAAGEARCTILISDTPSQSAKDAAAELAAVIGRASGAKVNIFMEGFVARQPLPADHAVVLVGDGQIARRLGVDSRSLPPEGFLVKVVGNHLVILGSDKTPAGKGTDGTFFGVAAFEERVLGCHWLWPGDTGTVIPRRADIRVPRGISLRGSPKILKRQIRNCLGNGFYLTDDVKRRLGGFDMGAYTRMTDESILWMRRHKLGGSVDLVSGHVFEDWYEKHYRQHPDWFAVQLNGSREWDPAWLGTQYNKQCLSSRSFLDHFVRLNVADLDRRFGAVPAGVRAGLRRRGLPLDAVGIGENDGGFQAFCLCAPCKALDPPEAPKVKLEYATGTIEYPGLADRYLGFYNRVAEGVAVRHPDVWVVGFAYGATTAPPVRTKAHTNVVIQYVGPGSPYDSHREWLEARRQWDGWAATGAKISWRPNWMRCGLDMMMLYHHKLAADLKYFADRGLIGTDFDTMMNDWGSQGLNYYVLARMLWDPDLDVEQLVDEYCRVGFGPAAAPVRAFFDHVEAMTEARAKVWAEPAPWLETVAPFFADRGFHQRADALLADARAKADGDAEILARLDLLHVALRFTRLRARIATDLLALRRGDKVDTEALRTRAAEMDALMREHKHSFAVNTAYAAWDAARFRDLSALPPGQ